MIHISFQDDHTSSRRSKSLQTTGKQPRSQAELECVVETERKRSKAYLPTVILEIQNLADEEYCFSFIKSTSQIILAAVKPRGAETQCKVFLFSYFRLLIP